MTCKYIKNRFSENPLGRTINCGPLAVLPLSASYFRDVEDFAIYSTYDKCVASYSYIFKYNNLFSATKVVESEL